MCRVRGARCCSFVLEMNVDNTDIRQVVRGGRSGPEWSCSVEESGEIKVLECEVG
jgi:hypothetical protein